MNTLIIIQTVVPNYRKEFYDFLTQELGGKIVIYTGNTGFSKTITTESNAAYKPLKNHFFLKRKLLIQTGFKTLVFSKNPVIIELNPRILSNWVILIIRKILGSKTVVWGHAWPRTGRYSHTDKIRGLMRRMAAVIITYSKTQEKELKLLYPTKEIKAAPNALYQTNQAVRLNKKNPINIIYVGRIVKEKNIYLLVNAFKNVLSNLPQETKLFCVGTGNLTEDLKKYLLKLNIKNRVELVGELTDIHKLKPYYDSSLVSVAPGTLGLFILQSFWFGTPIIFSPKEKNGPEVEAALPNQNCLTFKTENVDDLSKKILQVFEDSDKWIDKAEKIQLFAKENYSLERMSKPFKSLINES